MKFQTYIVEATRKAAAEAFRYAKAVPVDKLQWSPLDKGRSVLDQCRELAMTPTWAAEIIEGVEMDWSPEGMEAVKQKQSKWTSVEDCEAEFNRRLERMVAAFSGVTDEGLSNTKFLPFEGGRDFTFAEMMEYPRWNATYHLGQIAYVQILFGDGEMH